MIVIKYLFYSYKLVLYEVLYVSASIVQV